MRMYCESYSSQTLLVLLHVHTTCVHIILTYYHFTVFIRPPCTQQHTAHEMWPIATDGVVWSAVCLLVMFVSHAKTAEPIEMLFGVLTRVGLRKHLSVCMVH